MTETPRRAALDGVDLDDEGFLLDPAKWSETIVPALAARAGIHRLDRRHWHVIRHVRRHFVETGAVPTVRSLRRESGVSIGELYRLFPVSPIYWAALIAGAAAPVGLRSSTPPQTP